MKRVTGLGGVFFTSEDPASTRAWYRDRLGVGQAEWGHAFLWRASESPDAIGYTVWSAFPADTTYLDPSTAPFMINFRVADLDALLVALRAEGVRVVGDVKEEPNGKFAWILDPDGRKIELWEPVRHDLDPYLPADESGASGDG